MQLRNDDSEACQALKTQVGAEFERHQLLSDTETCSASPITPVASDSMPPSCYPA